MTVNTQAVASIIRQLAAIASMVLGAIPATDLPASVRVPLVAAGGILLSIEHYNSDPSTGNPVPPTTPPAK